MKTNSSGFSGLAWLLAMWDRKSLTYIESKRKRKEETNYCLYFFVYKLYLVCYRILVLFLVFLCLLRFIMNRSLLKKYLQSKELFYNRSGSTNTSKAIVFTELAISGTFWEFKSFILKESLLTETRILNYTEFCSEISLYILVMLRMFHFHCSLKCVGME